MNNWSTIVNSLQGELEDATVNLDRANSNSNQFEKRNRSFDKTITEWQLKVRNLQGELENAQKEGRSYSAELFRNKAAYEEMSSTIESLRKENSSLTSTCKFPFRNSYPQSWLITHSPFYLVDITTSQYMHVNGIVLFCVWCLISNLF